MVSHDWRCSCRRRRQQHLYNESFLSLHEKDNIQIVADLSCDEELKNIIDRCPKLDVCVNNAGISKVLTIKFIQKKTLNDVFGINTIAPILLTSALIRHKKFNNNASIVFISSISGISISTLGESSYSASKGAINGFVKGAAIELSSKQIRVNSVSPGLVETNILNLAGGLYNKENLNEKLKQYPLHRIGKPEDVAFGVIYLLSDASSWVTGSNIIIDGGFTLL